MMRDSINLGEGSQGLKLNQSVQKAIAILRENTNAADLAARRTYDLYVTELRVVSPDAEIKES